jgi:acyl dehydratase
MSYTAQHMFFDDVDVNQEWRSPGRTITGADIVNFAGLSGDFNPIHMDHEFAKSTTFRQPIAHGLLTLADSRGLAVQCPPMRTLAFMAMREWQFLGPVFIGDTVHVRSKVLQKEIRGRGRRGVITWERRVINQDDKVVQQGVTQTLVECRATKENATPARPDAAESS